MSNDMAKQLEALDFHHKQKYAKLKHELYERDGVITRLKQDIVDLQDKLDKIGETYCGWHKVDVLHMADEMEMKITEIEAVEILEYLDWKDDANVGVTWQTIEYAIAEHVHRRDGTIVE
jgi:hypothetical protein